MYWLITRMSSKYTHKPVHNMALTRGSGLVLGVETVGNISENDINVMMSTNVIGLINVRHE